MKFPGLFQVTAPPVGQFKEGLVDILLNLVKKGSGRLFFSVLAPKADEPVQTWITGLVDKWLDCLLRLVRLNVI